MSRLDFQTDAACNTALTPNVGAGSIPVPQVFCPFVKNLLDKGAFLLYIKGRPMELYEDYEFEVRRAEAESEYRRKEYEKIKREKDMPSTDINGKPILILSVDEVRATLQYITDGDGDFYPKVWEKLIAFKKETDDTGTKD